MAIETKYPARASGYITYEQYLAHETENHCTEWVDGKVVDVSMVSEEHSALTLFVLVLLRLWVEEHQAGAVLGEPYNMKVGPDLPGRSPDAMFIAEANQHRVKRSFLDGPCDLAVEIVSPDYRRADTVEKFAEYAQGGIPEYWIIDYAVEQAYFYGLNASGKYEQLPVGQDGIFHSRILPGLFIPVEWFWRRPLPTTRELIRVWNLL